ncbi:alpha/beta hydrolase [Brachybacterium sp. P6-10-X1]|uniref:alpha/beta fold hydrolase n=1 Tax=Brachybacterium sp. P6-10-X1 TaxID=1903186 RepID=UPI0009718D86|nr:alpha/beta fold hydrolase [Brachybacterium sp. P6-10-X1]APX31414.1 alpha/beta hydrolase [Brachybacterium sp. P6-10-X1]
MTPIDPPSVTASGLLPVGDGHEILWEESGAADGVPVLYLHGGPGGRLTPGYRSSVPADRSRLLGLSQRGAGRSTPSAGSPGPVDLSANTTTHLVADLERLREHRGIEAWIVEGVSWGSTLALAYAQAHPDRVLGVLLFAVTSTSRREVDWITEGVGALYPEAWDAFARVAEAHGGYDRHNRSSDRLSLVESYRRMVTSADPALVDHAARAWMTWEDAHIGIGGGGPSGPHAGAADDPVTAYERGVARLVTHYWAHDGFVADWAAPWGAAAGSGLLGGMDRLAEVPGVLIHGRRDVSGPALTAWELHRAWPGSELVIIEDEGHGGPGMVGAWRESLARMVDAAAASDRYPGPHV